MKHVSVLNSVRVNEFERCLLRHLRTSQYDCVQRGYLQVWGKMDPCVIEQKQTSGAS